MSNQPEKDFEKIIRYLNSGLTKEEQVAFEKQMLIDSELFEEVEATRVSAFLIKANASLNIKNKLSEYADEREKREFKQKKTAIISYWLSGIAACLVLGFILFHFSGQYSLHDKVFSDNFDPYQNIVMPTVMGAPSSNDSLVEKSEAYYAYDNKNYTLAITLFNKIKEKDADPYALFYLGNSYLSIGQSQKAVTVFNHILYLHTEFALSTQTKWYLGLSYLHSGKINKAKEALEDLADQGGEYGERAKKILNELT